MWKDFCLFGKQYLLSMCLCVFFFINQKNFTSKLHSFHNANDSNVSAKININVNEHFQCILDEVVLKSICKPHSHVVKDANIQLD